MKPSIYFYTTITLILSINLLVFGMSVYAFVIIYGWLMLFSMVAANALALYMWNHMPTDDEYNELESTGSNHD